LVSKWCGSVGGAYRTNPSGANEDTIMQLAHELYLNKVGKRFDLMHWLLLLKDIPKWETLCDESVQVASKRLRVNEMGAYFDSSFPGNPSTPNTPSTLMTPGSEDTPNEEGDGLLHPIGRKAAKRKAKEKVEHPYMEVMTKELAQFETSTVEKNSILAQYVQIQHRKAMAAEEAIELRDRHQSFKEEEQHLKVKKYEDKILKMNIAQMCHEDRARYG